MNNPEQPGRRPDDGSAAGPRVSGTDLAFLNERQRTIAWLIAQGHTNQQIGTAVNLDRAVVAEEVERLRCALGADTRLQLAVMVRQDEPSAARSQPDRTSPRMGEI